MLPKTISPLASNQYIVLDHRVGIFVPSNISGRVVDSSPQVEHIASVFSELFGGATAEPARGYWNGSAGLVDESITIVWAACTPADYEHHANAVIKLAEFVKSELQQEAVTVQFDNTLVII